MNTDSASGRLPTIAVTGTNGKTTTTSMLAAIIEASGQRAFVTTTLGARVGAESLPLGTDWVSFLGAAETAVAAGASVAVLEVTSRALANGFADRWPPDVAVFTGLSRDHLDRHKTAEDYLAAKARLFLALRGGGLAVLPASDSAADLIATALDAIPTSDGRARRVARFGLQSDSLPEADRARFGVAAAPHLGRVLMAELGRTVLHIAREGAATIELNLQTTGTAFAFDAVAAATGARSLGIEDTAIVAGLEGFAGVPGRFEIVARDPTVVVDFAHTPDALEALLRTARLYGRGRVILVFGCGGGRDAGKRPQMGALATRLADEVWLTTDNPRHEDPELIVTQIREGAEAEGLANWHDESNRLAAIENAVASASSDDIVLIAGKGHEKIQIVGDQELPFDDTVIARAAWTLRG